ncbi:MAG: prepilin-type N-terminal cleavage/methylation domain-containing protein [Planctomycetes bacterium]|nr:prepilin-type N-terminal cleavage/methylation domain-containing protein [Planctomycetota bacterium]
MAGAIGRARRGAFTLIELLVVIAIISVLVGLTATSLLHFRRRAVESTCREEVRRLAVALESYRTDFGDFPPSTTKELGLSDNDINAGNESLVASLATQKKHGPYFEFAEDRLENADADRGGPKVKDLSWIFGDDALREYVDPWGTPYVYFQNRDYGKKAKYRAIGEKPFEALAGKSERTAAYHGLTTFQIWSCGPNRTNENGAGDDIGSWQE